jgi:hypothetical protein
MMISYRLDLPGPIDPAADDWLADGLADCIELPILFSESPGACPSRHICYPPATPLAAQAIEQRIP